MLHHRLRAASGALKEPVAGNVIAKWTFDDVSGGYVNDAAGNYDALIEGSPAIVAGQVGNAMSFDGLDDCLRVGTIPLSDPLQLLGDFSITFWANLTNSGDDFQRILDKSTGGNAAGGWAIYTNRGATDSEIVISINGTAVAYNVISYGSWQLFEFKCESNVISLKVNGVTRAPVFGSGILPSRPNTSANLSIASWNHTTGRELNGILDEITIYNEAIF